MVEIKLDAAAIARLGESAQEAALATMEVVKSDLVSSQTVPYDNGTMQGSIETQDPWQAGDEFHTILSIGGSDSPQARRLYFHPEYNFQRGHNPNAGAAWYTPYLAGGEKAAFIPETFAALMKEKL